MFGEEFPMALITDSESKRRMIVGEVEPGQPGIMLQDEDGNLRYIVTDFASLYAALDALDGRINAALSPEDANRISDNTLLEMLGDIIGVPLVENTFYEDMERLRVVREG